jgi:uncharacterized protein
MSISQMDNPFRFSGIVDTPAFCNRDEEISDLKGYIQNSQNVLLYSHRRYGKSSLILKMFRELKEIKPVYIDLYGTTSPGEFVSAFLSGLCTLESKIDRLMKLIRDGIMSIKVNFSIDPLSGLPTMSPVYDRGIENRTIDELFGLFERFSRKTRLVIAFDEFQEVAGYGEIAFEKQLRKSIQTHERISYIFAGSQRHLLMEMFNNNKRAFYQQATSYPLNKIETHHYVDWVYQLYQQGKRSISSNMIEEVVSRCKNHPQYIQEFFHEMWSADDVNLELIDITERYILTKRVPEFAYTWDTLSLNQKRALKLLAATMGKNIFSADSQARFGFRTASQITAALSKLEKIGVVNKNDIWSIQDPFFEKWLQYNIGNIPLVHSGR